MLLVIYNKRSKIDSDIKKCKTSEEDLLVLFISNKKHNKKQF